MTSLALKCDVTKCGDKNKVVLLSSSIVTAGGAGKASSVAYTRMRIEEEKCLKAVPNLAGTSYHSGRYRRRNYLSDKMMHSFYQVGFRVNFSFKEILYSIFMIFTCKCNYLSSDIAVQKSDCLTFVANECKEDPPGWFPRDI